jgi:hypothetical protein
VGELEQQIRDLSFFLMYTVALFKLNVFWFVDVIHMVIIVIVMQDKISVVFELYDERSCARR